MGWSEEVKVINADLSLDFLVAGAGGTELALPVGEVRPGAPAMTFVVGSPRSGTTLVGRALGTHPLLVSGHESLFLVDLWRILADLHQGRNPRGFAPLAEYLELEPLIAHLAALSDGVFGGLLARHPAARGVVDHTPWYASLTPLLRALYPDCRVVHMIRDGRQVARSLARSYAAGFGWAGPDAAAQARLWSAMVRGGRSAAVLGEGYQELRYEDLERDPEGSLRRVLAGLDLPWEPVILEALAEAHAGPSRSRRLLARRLEGGGVEVTPQAPRTGWPEGWSADERRAFEAASGGLLGELGYT